MNQQKINSSSSAGAGTSRTGMKAAYVTLVTAENYFPGAVALVRSLKRTKTSFPLVVITTEGLRSNLQDQLRDLGAEVRCLPRLQVPILALLCVHHQIHIKVS